VLLATEQYSKLLPSPLRLISSNTLDSKYRSLVRHQLALELPGVSRMKKVKSANRSSAMKGGRAAKNIDEYLAGVPEPARGTLNRIRAVIRSAAPPEAIEAISYGMPTFKYKGPLVWFAAFSNHCSLFPTASVIEAFKDELKGFSTTKGTIHFTADKPLPTALVKRLVKARVAQQENKKPR
jgi:uncharacterized protein YdhG (YjbR/CyaY superfamily)